MMANIAITFHFSYGDMMDMALDELNEWHDLAVEYNKKD